MKKLSFSIIALSLLAVLFSCNKKCDMPAAVVVDAGVNQKINLPVDSVTLTGTVTSGLTPNMTYLWTVISGPSVPTFSSATSTTTFAKNLVEGSYVLQFQATNNAGNTGLDTVTINVNITTLIIQPGFATGQDAEVDYVPGLYDGNGNDGTAPYIRVIDWTYSTQGAGEGWYRSYLKFTALDTLPAGAQIISAKLSLYGLNDSLVGAYWGNSTFLGSPYTSSGDNSCLLQRVISNWDQSTITWFTKPNISTVDEVTIPASTSQWNYNTIDLDVTQLVKDMTATPGTNYGFCMRLTTETYYREIGYCTSEAGADSSNAPKLVITYKQ